MSKITSKILGLGGMAVVFAGMSFGQTLSCTYTAAGGEPNPILDRFEDTTALVADVEYSCTPGSSPALSGASATLSLNEPVTSKVTGPGGLTEAVMIINDITTPASSSVTQGAISLTGTQLLFSPVSIPAGTDTFTIRFANVRVNASMAPSATSNFAITESVFIANLDTSVFPVLPTPTVGIVVQGFGKPAFTAGVTPNPVNYVICTANPAAFAGTSFQITYGENLGGAFKTQTPSFGGETCNGGACTLTNGEQGSYTGTVGAGVTVTGFSLTNTGGAAGTAIAGLGTATHGTRVQFAFANIPTGAQVFVPLSITNGTLTLTLTASATGAFSALPANGPKGSAVAALWAPPAGATGNAIYEVTKTDNTVSNESFNLIGTVVAAPNFATSAQTAITVTVGPAPNSGTDIPTFVNINTAMTLSAFSLCQTTLLFPFAAAGGGFDTGIAISNTGLDPYAAAFTAGGTPGACTFNFYGTGAPTPSTNVSLPTATFTTPLAPGSTGSFSLAGMSVAPNFVGYIIAQCGFLYGHGFSYITYNNGTPSATAEGYLAIVLLNNRSVNAVGQGPEGIAF